MTVLEKERTKAHGKVIYEAKVHSKGGRNGCPQQRRLCRPEAAAAAPGRREPLRRRLVGLLYGRDRAAASQRKIKLRRAGRVDAEIDLNLADGAYFLRARLNVSVPGVDRAVPQA